MKHPQDLAKNLNQYFPNESLKKIADNACCIFVLMWCLGIEPDDVEAVMMAQLLREKKVVNDECVVYWYKAVPYLCGKELESVEFKKIKSLKELPLRLSGDKCRNG